MGFPKRCLESFLQMGAMLASGGAVAAAIFTQIRFSGLSSTLSELIQGESNARDQNELFLRTQATTGLVFGATAVVAIFGLIALVGRLCETRNEKTGSKISTCLYLLFVTVCFMGFAAAGILGVFTTIDWSEIESGVINQGVDILNSLLNNFGVSLEEAEVIEEIRNAIAATSGCSLLAALLFLILDAIVLICWAAVKNY